MGRNKKLYTYDNISILLFSINYVFIKTNFWTSARQMFKVRGLFSSKLIFLSKNL